MRAPVPRRATAEAYGPAGAGRARLRTREVPVEVVPEPVPPEGAAAGGPDGHGDPVVLDVLDVLDEELAEEAAPEPLEPIELEEEGICTADGTGAGEATATGTEGGEEDQVAPTLDLEDRDGDEDPAEEVEAALDQILAQRTAADLLEADGADQESSAARRARLRSEDETVVVRLRQPDEFVCARCFLVQRRELLADAEQRLCRDCAA